MANQVPDTIKKIAAAIVKRGDVLEEYRSQLEQELDHQLKRRIKLTVSMLLSTGWDPTKKIA